MARSHLKVSLTEQEYSKHSDTVERFAHMIENGGQIRSICEQRSSHNDCFHRSGGIKDQQSQLAHFPMILSITAKPDL